MVRPSWVWMLLQLLICCVYPCSRLAVASEEAKTKSWSVHHRVFSPGMSSTSDWSLRGSIQLIVDPNAEERISVKIDNTSELTRDLAQSLSSAQFYQIKLQETGAVGTAEILTSVAACDVRRANFRDEFVLQLHPSSAQALSVTYMPLISPLAPDTCDEYKSLPETLQFESKAGWETSVPGMTVGKPPPKVIDPLKPQPKVVPPPGLKWVPGASSRKKAQNGAFPDENRPPEEAGMFGFFKRYWYVILPVLIINLMSTGEQAPASQGAAPQAQPQHVGAAADVAAGGAAASKPAQRRGKRE
jgi:hypothetical protein